MKPNVTILRLGHRLVRDQRISPHVGLVARQFGADRIIFTGEEDSSLVESMERIKKQWGGNFEAEYVKSWRNLVKNWEEVVNGKL